MMTVHDIIELIVGSMLTVAFTAAAGAFSSIGKRLFALELAMEKRVSFGELGKTVKELHDKTNNQGERIAILEDWRRSK
jgi:hypothetical protein